jgi:hypothetical protein
MILPGQLNGLLEIYPSKSVLIVDLRSASDFEKSHIHDAVNLRAPLVFIENTSLEMIEDTFMDDQSRRSFSQWRQCRCVVFYDRVVEFDWECPASGALYDKFRSKGWRGQGFILKGHFKEFSASFDRHISGSKMSKEAKEHLDGLRGQSSLTQVRAPLFLPRCQIDTMQQEEADQRHRRYDAWLRAVMTEDRVPRQADLIPARKLDRRRAVEQHQKELETEFSSRFPAHYRKAIAMGKRRPDSPPPPSAREPSPPPPFERGWGDEPFREVEWNAGESVEAGVGRFGSHHDTSSFSDRKAALVEPLASGLEKIRGAVAGGYVDDRHGYGDLGAPMESGYGGSGGYMPADKLDAFPEDFDEIDPKSEGLKNDPLFQRAGDVKLQEAGGGGSEEGGSKKSVKMGNLKRPPIWERLRSSGK